MTDADLTLDGLPSGLTARRPGAADATEVAGLLEAHQRAAKGSAGVDPEAVLGQLVGTGSWTRRQAHELAVHRMDLEAAACVPHAPIDPELAEDGVDELLGIVLPRWAHTEPLAGADATIGVSCTDTGRTWSVRVVRGHVTVRPERTGDEDASAHGDATALLLHLWGRPADVVVDGDPSAEALLRGR